MARRRALGLALALPLVVCALAPGAARAAGSDVTIQNSAYQPSSVTVSPGTTVTWHNLDAYSHTVTADDGSFDSMNLGGAGTYQHTFSQPGQYSYHCNIHSFMHGTVTVGGAQPPATQPPPPPTAGPGPAPTAAPARPAPTAAPRPATTVPPTTVSPTTTTLAAPAAAVTIPSTPTTAAAAGGEHNLALAAPARRTSSDNGGPAPGLVVLAAVLAAAAGAGGWVVHRRVR